MCKRHGGTSANHTKHALKLMAEAQLELAMEAVGTLGLPLDIGPQDALLEEVQRTAGHVAWLAERIAALTLTAVLWNTTERQPTTFAAQNDAQGPCLPSSPQAVSITESAALTVWLDLYQRERRHLVEVAHIAITCGVAERSIEVSQRQGQQIAVVVEGALADLGVESGQPAVRAAVRRHLVLVNGEVSP